MGGVINWSSIGGILVDMVLISILVSTIYSGYRRGLVGVAFHIATFIVSIIIVLVVYKPVSQAIIDKTDWDDKLSIAIQDRLTGAMIDEEGNIIPDNTSKIPTNMINFVNKLLKDPIDKAKMNMTTYVSNNLAIVMVRYGTMIVLFVISNILLSFLKSVFELIASLPFIRLFNRSGGIIYGIVKGFLIVYFILAILSVFSPLISHWGIINAVNDAFIGSRMYNNNILLNFVLGK